MVRAGCVFVAGIHPSRTWTSGSFEPMRWNACMHRLDLGLYSHPKEFLGNGVWTHVNSKGKVPSTENVPRGGSNPRHCGQRAQALPTELFWPLNLLYHYGDAYHSVTKSLISLWWCIQFSVTKSLISLWWCMQFSVTKSPPCSIMVTYTILCYLQIPCSSIVIYTIFGYLQIPL